jgi:hypothetical protein
LAGAVQQIGELVASLKQPKKTLGRMVKTPDGYIMEKQEVNE